MASLVIFYPKIYHLIAAPNRILQEIWKITAVSVSVQIGVFPLAIYYFHQFPVYFILTNLLVIHLSFIVIFTGMIMFILSFTLLHVYLGILLSKLIGILITLVKFIEAIPGSSIQQINFNGGQLIIIYLIIICFAGYLYFKKSLLIKSLLIAAILFIVYSNFNYYKISHQKKIIIYNQCENLVCELICGDRGFVINNSELDDYEISCHRNSHFKYGLKETTQIPLNSNRFQNNYIKVLPEGMIHFAGINLFILQEQGQLGFLSGSSQVIWDYIIIGKNTFPDLHIKYPEKTSFILLPNNDSQKVKNWRKSKPKINNPVYIISNEGAFMEEF